MDARKRHLIVWKILRPVATFLWRVLYNFHAEQADVKGPILFFANHVTDLDPVMAACSFKEQIYFVASEHLMRGRFGPLVTWLQAPIPRQKGGSAADTVMTTLRHIKKGYSVGIFPEGVTYAILLMNGFAPIIERCTPPRRFGAQKGAKA